MTEPDELPEDAGFDARAAAIAAVAGIVFLFAAGALTGMLAAAFQEGVRSPLKFAGIAALVVAAMLGCLWVLRRRLGGLWAGPVSPRIRRARLLMAFFLVIGAAIGILLSEFGPVDLWGGSARELSPTLAIAVILVWVVVVPIATIAWWRQIDEHEALAYKDGGFFAANAYATIAPAWWFGWRAGLFPAPDQIAIFLVTMSVWGAVWFVRRFN